MTPGLAIGIVALGAVAVWVLTRTPGAGLPATSQASQASQQSPISVQVPGGSTTAQNVAQGWSTGGSIGGSLSGVAGAFGPWVGVVAAGVGALTGWIVSITGNSTKDAREKFAYALGFESLGAENGPGVPGRALYATLTAIGRDDLANEGLNIIGRNDHTRNQDWMRRVLTALQTAAYSMPNYG